MIESGRHVIGIRRYRKICRVTRVTIRVHQLVVAIDMTRLARRGEMRSRESKPGRTMVERRWQPGRRRVTGFASMIQHSRHMIRIRRSGIVRGMTWVAVGIHQQVIAVRVT